MKVMRQNLDQKCGLSRMLTPALTDGIHIAGSFRYFNFQTSSGDQIRKPMLRVQPKVLSGGWSRDLLGLANAESHLWGLIGSSSPLEIQRGN